MVSLLFSASYPQDRRSYYLFFNYLSYYLYMFPVCSKNRGGMFPVCSKIGFANVPRMLVENSPKSPAPVETSRRRATRTP